MADNDNNSNDNVISITQMNKEAPELVSNHAFWSQNPKLYEEYIKVRTPIQLDARRKIYPKLYKHFSNTILKSKVKTIDQGKIKETPHFRISGRDHKTKDDLHYVKDLEEQIVAFNGIFTPLVVLKDPKGDDFFHLISGKKRLKAMRCLGITGIPCKILDGNKLINKLPHGLAPDSNLTLIMEVCNHLSYAESMHTSGLTDEQIISFLRVIRYNHGLEKNDFREVMKLIGLSRKSPKYNNLRRLWFIACNPFMVKLLENQWVPTRILKKEEVSNVFFFNHELSERIYRRIETYIEDLEPHIKDRDKKEPPFRWSNYELSEVIDFILDLDQEGASSVDRYRNPKVKVKVSGSRLNIPSINLNFSDGSENNIRSIVETYFQMKHVVSQVESFLKGYCPDEIGGDFKSSSFHPEDIEYGKRYIDFIREYRLERYINLPKVDRYFKKKNPLRPLLEKEEAKGLYRDQKNKKAIENFISYSQVEHEQEEESRTILTKERDERILRKNSFRREFLQKHDEEAS